MKLITKFNNYIAITLTLFCFTTLHPLKNFSTSMDINSVSYKKKYMYSKNKNMLEILNRSYSKYNVAFQLKTLRIPKIIHQIWVGSKPIPEMYKKFQQSWKEKHPHWEYKLWTDKEVEKLNLVNHVLYNKTKDYREKADLLRYELIEQFGGLYVDMDFECLKPLDLLHYNYDLYVGVSANDTSEIVNNALIAACPNHPIISQMVRNIKIKKLPDWRFRSGVFYFSGQFCNLIGTDPGRNVALPTSFFYPIPLHPNKELSVDSYVKPETMALHYWGNTSDIR